MDCKFPEKGLRVSDLEWLLTYFFVCNFLMCECHRHPRNCLEILSHKKNDPKFYFQFFGCDFLWEIKEHIL